MPEAVYRRLAQRLNAIPNGFPPTESGVELRLLAQLFTPEQATLACVLRLTHEPAATIAVRSGVESRSAYRILKKMAKQGLIYAGKGQDGLTFALMPFIVGIYEMQLPRMEKELAELFEAYLQETRGCGIIDASPALHRVIPVDEAVPVTLEVFSYERASALIEGAESWGVRDCICRVQQRLLGAGCHHPVEVCLVFAPVPGAFDYSQVDRAISREEALDILRKAQETGLVHTTGNYRDGHFYICNCCTCACGLLRGVAEFGHLSAVGPSRFRAAVERQDCALCGDCLTRCQFNALTLAEAACVVDPLRCVGCGQCTIVCPTGALRLVSRPQEEMDQLPVDHREWLERRAAHRGIDLSDVR